jgi:hypothetical protein
VSVSLFRCFSYPIVVSKYPLVLSFTTKKFSHFYFVISWISTKFSPSENGERRVAPGKVWKRRVGMVGSLRDVFDEGWTVVVIERGFVVYNSR